MLKVIYKYYIESFSILDNPLYDCIILVLVGLATLYISYRMVGMLYCENIIVSRKIGSILHWGIRFIVFSVICFTLDKAVRLYKLIMEIPKEVINLIIGTVVIVIVALAVVKLKVLNNKENM